MNKEHLKNQALIESISSLTATYENKIADLRVEITELTGALNDARQQLEDALAANNEVKEEDVEVVQEDSD